MPKVYMQGHNFAYHVSDVMRMFYTGLKSNENQVKTVECDEFSIYSKYENNVVVTTWYDGENEKSVKEKVNIDTKKRAVKRQLYIALSDITGINLPWGSLTGIRPTLVSKEVNYDFGILTKYYKVSDIKAYLAIETAKTEEAIKQRLDKNKIHCYIGIPICYSRCSYCSFLSGEYSTYKKWIPEYVDALIYEIKELLPLISDRIGSIYIGGGTPSILSNVDLERMLSEIEKIVGTINDLEITFEAGRADSLDFDKLQIIKKYNVNRLCINPQTLNDETLRLIKRNHTKDDFLDIYKKAKELGFRTLNTDLIAGFNNESVSDFENSLQSIIELAPENITIHALSVKKLADFKKEIQLINEGAIKNKFNIPNKTLSEMINMSYNYLKNNEYKPYYMYRQKDTAGGQENVGYTKDGHECLYNVAMMGDNNSILGLGAKSVSKKIAKKNDSVEIMRYHNIRDIILYAKNIEKAVKEKKEFFDL